MLFGMNAHLMDCEVLCTGSGQTEPYSGSPTGLGQENAVQQSVIGLWSEQVSGTR